MTDQKLAPMFLGPYAENNDLFEKLWTEFFRDHVYWRRNFHPEDPPAISTSAIHADSYIEFVDTMRRELHGLSARLKQSVPFFSPRYMGHMASDLLLPGLLAQAITQLYNPNNVSEESAPVTLDLELEVGLQLARMVGFRSDTTRPDCAFGYLASGGTAANYQGLRTLLSIKCFPLAVVAAATQLGLADLLDKLHLSGMDSWQLFNMAVDEVIEVRQGIARLLTAEPKNDSLKQFAEQLADHRVEHLGLSRFLGQHDLREGPVVLIPATAHYSWAKAMSLLGLGTAQLIVVKEQGMRMDPGDLASQLDQLLKDRRPVLSVVGVLGTTEFGTLDPVHEIIAARDRYRQRGLSFAVHVDAAWGGYLATLLREPDGGLRALPDVAGDFNYFPSEDVYRAIAAMADADSITVDPHKLGYVPFGTGAYLCRDQRMMDFLAQDAAYVFDERNKSDNSRKRFQSLGRYIIEGSKAGSAAAAVWLTHRCLPLDHQHFGRLPAATIKATEYFWTAALELGDRISDVAHLIVPFEPDSNLICLALCPKNCVTVAQANAFVEAIFSRLRVNSQQPLQLKQFFGSTTRLYREAAGPVEIDRVLGALGLAPDVTNRAGRATGGLLILRHTLMNPWLIDELNQRNYIAMYCEYLEKIIREQLATSGD